MRSLAVFAALTLSAILHLGSCAHSAPQFPQYRGDATRTGRSTYASPTKITNTTVFNIGANCSGSPVIGQDGTVYFGAYNKKLYAVESDGSLKWTYNAPDSIYGTVAIGSNGTIYFGTQSGTVQAVDQTGTYLWQYKLTFPSYGVSSAMMVHKDGSVYFGADDKYIYALNSDGSFKWKFLTGGAVKQGVTSSLDGSVIYGVSNDGCLYAINNSTGKQIWKKAIGAVGVCTVGDDGSIYIGSSNNAFYAFNPDGTAKWTFTGLMAKVTSSAAVAKDGTVYFGCADSYIYAVNSSRNYLWKYRTNGSVYSAPLLDALGNIICGTYDGAIVSLDSGNGSPNWLKDIGNGPIYTSPVLSADGSVYVINSDQQLVKLTGPVPVLAAEPSLILILSTGVGLIMRRSTSRRRKS